MKQLIHAISLFFLISNSSHAQFFVQPGSLVEPNSQLIFAHKDRTKEHSDSVFPVWITGVHASTTEATVNSEVLLKRQSTVCSAYDAAVCHNSSHFYSPQSRNYIVTGLYHLSNNAVFHFGLNSGFESSKLSVSPAILLGGTRRFFLNDKKLSSVTVEALGWFGSKVRHRPCIDDYNREYFCSNLTAWSDFKYDQKPKSYVFRVWYEHRF